MILSGGKIQEAKAGDIMDMIVRASKGQTRRTVAVDNIRVPDLRDIIQSLPTREAKEMVLDCWHLCHDLLMNIKAHRDGRKL